jgi:thiamine-phosphate pyrophosphorylase
MKVNQTRNNTSIVQQNWVEGLYAITPDIENTNDLVEKVDQVLSSGVQFIQYRNKTNAHEQRVHQACAIKKRCQRYGAKLIINDHLDIALAVNADGLHLGSNDITIREARAYLGKHKIIGASCYNQLDLALVAEKEGANYVAFGAFSRTKMNTVKANPDLLIQAKKVLKIPIVAIGGISVTNAALLISNGCDAIAVSNSLFNAVNIPFAVNGFTHLFLVNP